MALGLFATPEKLLLLELFAFNSHSCQFSGLGARGAKADRSMSLYLLRRREIKFRRRARRFFYPILQVVAGQQVESKKIFSNFHSPGRPKVQKLS